MLQARPVHPTYLRRPCWNHEEIKVVAAQEIVEPVKRWCEEHGALEEDHDDRQFLALLSLALQECPDAYQAGRYIEDFLSWPVTLELVKILERAYARMPLLVTPFVKEWVLANGIRFPAQKGQVIKFRVGDVELQGKIVEVLKAEAKGVVTIGTKNRHWSVNAEDVIEVVDK